MLPNSTGYDEKKGVQNNSYDVVIAGAGILGASLAWRLAQNGLRVKLADAASFGGESSSAGAGMLAPGGEITTDNEFTRLLLRSLELYPSFVAELEQASGQGIDFAISGAFDKAFTDEEAAALRNRVELQSRLGIQSERVSSSEFFYPGDGWVNPVDILAALKTVLLRDTHVAIAENASITRIEPAARSVVVDGVTAHAIVVAAGAWSSRLQAANFSLPEAYPVKGHLLGYQLPPGSIPSIHRSGHTYILQRSNGFTILGASQEDAGFDKGINKEVAAAVRERGEALLPLLREHQPVSVWTGLRPGAAKPLFHRVPQTNIWLAYGHLRNGILSAPATAERLAAEITSSAGRDSSVPGSNP